MWDNIMKNVKSASNYLENLSSVKKALLQKRLRVKELGATIDVLIPKRLEHTPAVLSSMQQRLWYLDQLEPGAAVYNIPSAFRLSGKLNIDALQNSINEIVNRYDILRTSYLLEEEKVVPVVSPASSVKIPVVNIEGQNSRHQQVNLEGQLREEARRPFNLSKGPIFHTILYKLSDIEHVLFFMVHHIAFDGWSFRIFLSELSKGYTASIENHPASLPELSIQYADFALWHQQGLQRDSIKRQMDYWLAKLGGDLPILNMPTDFPRPPHQSLNGSIERMHIEHELIEQLTAVGRLENATLYMVLLAAFKVLLHRYTGQHDLLLGTSIANRNHKQTEGIIGLLANTLVLRTTIEDRPSFWRLLQIVRDTCLDAFAHPDAPFERLVEELNPERDLSITPVFQVMFSFQMVEGLPDSMSGISISPVDVPLSVARTDLSLWINQTEKGLDLGLEYCTDLFSKDTAGRLLANYEILLESIAATPDANIDKLQMVSQNEKLMMERKFNATDEKYPNDKCLHEVIESQCNRSPGDRAVVFGEAEISYQELNERSNQLAHFLRSEGVGPNVVVGICLERCIEMVIGMLGILKSGGAYLPLDPDYPTLRLIYMLENSKSPVIITKSSLKHLFSVNENVRTICIDDDKEIIATHQNTTPKNVNRPDNLAYVIYTSGSTGKPKGVQVPHGAVVNFLFSMCREPGMEKKDVLVAVTTLSFDIHVLEIYMPLIIGATVVVADRKTASDGNLLLNLLHQSQATIMQATPSTWRLLLAAGWPGSRDLKILCGGEAFPKDILKELLLRSHSVWNMYGPTETTVWSSCYHLTNADEPILIGRPIANTQIYILDRFMQHCPIGVPGELHIGGDGVSGGYLNYPELTEKQFVPDPFRSDQGACLYKTGDLARFRPDGNLEYLGRIDTQVKVRGFRIELGEIESVLSGHPSVDKCVVTVREDSPGDVRLIAYIVPRGGTGVDVSSIRSHIRIKLPDYMVPQNFVELEQFPLTPAGKVDRKNLPVIDFSNVAKNKSYVAPRNPLEIQLVKLWEKILRTNPISVTDNFFDLGGHSLLVVRLFSGIEKMIGEKLPLALLYQAPTIEQLAKCLKDKNWSKAWSTLVPIQPEGSKPPLFLVHGAGGNVLLYRQLAFYLGADQPIYAFQAKGLDGKEPVHTSIEAMAAEYIQEQKKLQSEGPYYLGGYCMGGSIAYEMARQLLKEGHPVGMVAMFDTFNGWKKPRWPRKIYHHYQRIAFHFYNYLMIGSQDRKLFISEKIEESKRRTANWFSVKISQLLYRAQLRKDKPLVLMENINDKAAIEYVAAQYPGRIDLFRSKSAYAGYEDTYLGWDNNVVKQIELHQLNVYPGGTLTEPFIKELALKLKACINLRQDPTNTE
jgi:amino acid adenylation domain-containing protein